MYYSETQFYKEVKRKGGKVQLQNQDGENIVVDEEYLNQINSVDRFDKTEKLNRTDLIEKVLEYPRTAMSIYFQKADKAKTKKAFTGEKKVKIDEIQLAPASKVTKLLEDLIDNPILDYIPGEMREIKGYHTGLQADNRGRLSFIDMEDEKVKTPKGVDTRTIEYVIINNVKYIKK